MATSLIASQCCHSPHFFVRICQQIRHQQEHHQTVYRLGCFEAKFTAGIAESPVHTVISSSQTMPKVKTTIWRVQYWVARYLACLTRLRRKLITFSSFVHRLLGIQVSTFPSDFPIPHLELQLAIRCFAARLHYSRRGANLSRFGTGFECAKPLLGLWGGKRWRTELPVIFF